jgi:ribosome-associated protein
LSDALVVGPLVIPGSELLWDAVRSSGPGGQHVNKTSTKIELRYDVARSAALPEDVRRRLVALAGSRIDKTGVLHLTSERTRDRLMNLADARAKLVALLTRALVAPKVRRATRPTRASERRRLDEKRRRAQTKSERKTRPE